MGTGIVDQLHDVIDALAAVDIDALPDDALDDLTIRLQRARHRLDAATATVGARWDRRGVWRSDGSRSAAARLARDTSTSLPRARRDLRRAHHLTTMPVLAEAVGEGRLSMDHVDLLAEADTTARHDAFVRDEAMLVEQCQELRFTQAVQALGYWKLRVDANGETTPTSRRPPTQPPPRLHHADGVVRLDGHLDPLGGATFLTELDRLMRQLYLADEAAGVTRTAAQRRAAALVEMATRSASTPQGSRRPAPLFTVVLGDDSFAHLCELANGTIIDPGHLVPYMDTALLETVLFADPLTAVGVSPQRSFTGRLRRAVEVRTRHCEHPSGCDEPVPRCDVDHITPHSHGGVTSQFNGRLECWPHNRDATLHDHDAEPLPERQITDLDQLRAILRWKLKHEHPDEWTWLTGRTADESPTLPERWHAGRAHW